MIKIKKILKIITSIVIFSSLFTPLVFASEIIGPGKTTALYIDHDGDGYGVEAPLGADCDDNDPNIHKLANYTEALQYIPHNGGQIYYIASDGNDNTGQPNDVTHPYATSQSLENVLQPDDVVVYRGGHYNMDSVGAISSHKGVNGHPITFMAYPGETPVIERYNQAQNLPNNEVIGGNHVHDLVYDGLVLENAAMGGDFNFVSRLLIKNCVFRNNTGRGLMGMQDLKDITVTKSIFHDTGYSHGIYFGSRDYPNENIFITNNIFYHNGRTGFQHNGRVNNLHFENNIIHSNELHGVSVVNGVHNSFFINNLIFNNNKQGIVIQTHHNPQHNEIAYLNHDNYFINNTIWVGKNNNGLGTREPELFPCIEFNMAKDQSDTENGRYINNQFINNICINNRGPFLRYYDILDHYTSVYKNNIFYHTGNNPIEAVMTDVGDGTADRHEQYYYWNFDTGFGNQNNNTQDNQNIDPKIIIADLNDQLHPEKFNLDLLVGSPAIDNGLVTNNNPSRDLKQQNREQLIDIGAYEYFEGFGTEIRADVDQNLAINSTDAMLTLRNSLGLDMSSTNWVTGTHTGDVNCDDDSNSTDVMLILRKSLGLDMTGTGWCIS